MQKQLIFSIRGHLGLPNTKSVKKQHKRQLAPFATLWFDFMYGRIQAFGLTPQWSHCISWGTSVLLPGVKYLHICDHRSQGPLLDKIDDSMTWYFAFVRSISHWARRKIMVKLLTWHYSLSMFWTQTQTQWPELFVSLKLHTYMYMYINTFTQRQVFRYLYGRIPTSRFDSLVCNCSFLNVSNMRKTKT